MFLAPRWYGSRDRAPTTTRVDLRKVGPCRVTAERDAYQQALGEAHTLITSLHATVARLRATVDTAEAERVLIVAWLRKQTGRDSNADAHVRHLAEMIENGAHLTTKEPA